MFAINEIKINIIESSDLELEIKLKEDSKLNLSININKNCRLNLNIITKGKLGKIQYKYNLEENSFCNVFKFQNINSIKEMIIANLNVNN